MNIKKVGFTTLLLFLSILATGCGNSTKSITNDIEDYDFENAYSNYLENVKLSDKKAEADIKIETSLNSIYDNVIDKYATGELDTEEISFLKEIAKEISAEDSEKFRDFLRNINEIESSINSYNKGIDSYNNNEYSSALSYFEQVDEIDVAHFSDAEKKIVECKELIVKEKNVSIRELIANGEFDEALEEISRFSYINETDAYRLSLETKAAVTEKADKKIEKYFSDLDYFGAHDYITELSSKYNFDTLKDRVNGLKNNYITFVLNEAENDADSNNYEAATSVIEIAMTNLGEDNEQLNQAYKEYKSYLPIYINELDYMSCVNYVYKQDTLSDNIGNLYHNGLYMFREDWPGHYGEGSAEYFIQGKYETFSGTTAVPKGFEKSDKSAYFEVYGDGKLLYTAPLMKKDSFPEPFSIDVKDVKVLKILYPESNENAEMATIYDGLLTPVSAK